MWRDEATLLGALRAAHLTLEFRGLIEKAVFLSDLKTQAAVLHELRGRRRPRSSADARAPARFAAVAL